MHPVELLLTFWKYSNKFISSRKRNNNINSSKRVKEEVVSHVYVSPCEQLLVHSKTVVLRLEWTGAKSFQNWLENNAFIYVFDFCFRRSFTWKIQAIICTVFVMEICCTHTILVTSIASCHSMLTHSIFQALNAPSRACVNRMQTKIEWIFKQAISHYVL